MGRIVRSDLPAVESSRFPYLQMVPSTYHGILCLSQSTSRFYCKRRRHTLALAVNFTLLRTLRDVARKSSRRRGRRHLGPPLRVARASTRNLRLKLGARPAELILRVLELTHLGEATGQQRDECIRQGRDGHVRCGRDGLRRSHDSDGNCACGG